MIACDFAACTDRAPFHADGWDFCSAHLREHGALKADGHLRGQTPKHPYLEGSVNGGRVPNCALTREELLHAVLQEVGRPVPPPRLVNDWVAA